MLNRTFDKEKKLSFSSMSTANGSPMSIDVKEYWSVHVIGDAKI